MGEQRVTERREGKSEAKGVKRQVESVEYNIIQEKKRKEEEKEAEKRKRIQEERSETKRLKVQQKEAEKRKREVQEDNEKAEKKAKEKESEEVGEGDQQMDIEGEIAAALYRVGQPDVAEFYSPPRITEEAKKWGLTPGMAFDLTIGWDFRRKEDRQKAMDYVKEKKPKLVIGSPMCTMFSALQNLSKWTEEKQIKWCEAKEHIKFMVEI